MPYVKSAAFTVLIGLAAILVWKHAVSESHSRDQQQPHYNIRSEAIKSHLRLRKYDTIIVGDSIVELAVLDRLCTSAEVLNAGLGGATIDQIANIIPSLMTVQTPKRVVISVGVNNAISGAEIEPQDFSRQYETLVSGLLKMGVDVRVMLIGGVADNMPLGSNYFNRERISQLNKEIGNIAKKFNLKQAMPQNTSSVSLDKSMTIDGVHLNPAGYAEWERAAASLACSL